jgi:hypothetical protein
VNRSKMPQDRRNGVERTVSSTVPRPIGTNLEQLPTGDRVTEKSQGRREWGFAPHPIKNAPTGRTLGRGTNPHPVDLIGVGRSRLTDR